MKFYEWDKEKNDSLKLERGVSFDEVLIIISENRLIDTVDHPNKKKYSNQRMFIVEINHYIYLVPFVEEGEKIFLKTIIPSRKATRKYLVML